MKHIVKFKTIFKYVNQIYIQMPLNEVKLYLSY